VFDPQEQIALMPSHLAVCVARLQNVKLVNSNLDVIDDAFEYLMNKSAKSEKGQFFTPRYVIDMCVRMLNPKENESMIDTAAGSCGFPVHTIFHVWGNIYDRLGIPRRDMFTAEVKPSECIDYVREKVFAIDFDENAVKVARTLNLIAGDGRTNIMRLNTLDYGNWDEMTTLDWMQKYSVGWLKMQDFCETAGDYSSFNFDIVMANPPFAGDIQQKEIIYRYELALDSKGKYASKIGRDILFIERNIHFLKPGGRMAIILPQGRFNNSSDKYIRDFIARECRILAVIGLHENVFKPHTGTKTSVLLVQKWDDDLCPRREDYPVFFATMRKPGKDNSGEKIYARDSQGNILRDSHFHPVVSHDLYNHEGLTQDGIAEAFIEFAKREGLSFFGDARFSEERYRELVSGLEVREVMLSELLSNKYFRVDADYYSKKYTNMDSQLTRAGYWLMRQIATEITDFGAFSQTNMITYLDNGILFLRNQDIREGIINLNDNIFIAEDIYHKLTLHLQENDIVIPRVGTLGNAAMIYRDMLPATANQNLAVVRVNKNINPLYIVALLVSEIGKQQINRLSTGNVQQWLNLEAIGNIKVPAFGDELQDAIGSMMNEAVEIMNTSREKYTQAQSILNDAIHFTPRNPDANTSVVSFSQVFSTGRMDAEYFMPQYDELLAHLETLPAKRLGEIVNITKSIEPGSESYSTEGIPFIRVSDITETGITPPAIRIPWAAENEKLYPKKDTILLSKDGTIGIAYKVDSDIEAVTSGALLHLRVTASEVMPDYLALVLNSEAVRLQAERDSNGAIIKHWKPGDIARTVIPIFDSQTQQSISEHVRDSFTLRKESERLIALAVKSVELAVESDEHSAMRLIQEESQ